MEMSNKALQNDVQQITVEKFRKNYCKPELKALGDLRTLTLSGSYIGTDSYVTPTCNGSNDFNAGSC